MSVVKKAASVVIFLVFAVAVCPAQSGRKLKVVKIPPPEEKSPAVNQPKDTKPANVTAEPNEYYRCTDGKSLERILTPDQQPVFTPKEVDTRAVILTRPAPEYTREARQKNVQGLVLLSVVLGSDAAISSVGVVRPLPAGLTQTAMRAACKIRFKPAIKDGKEVSVRVVVEYLFRTSKPSIVFP